MAWVTALCFTHGIFSVESIAERGAIAILRGPGDRYDRRISRADVHDSREAAVAYANKKRLRRIAALQQQIERLKRMEF